MNRKTYERLINFEVNVLCVVLGLILGGIYAIGHWSNLSWAVSVPKNTRNIESIPKYENLKDAPIVLIAQDTYVTDDKYDTVEEYFQTVDVGYEYNYSGSKLTALKGVNKGPIGKETWYNLDMAHIVERMRQKGYSEEEYPYWIREDGVKMLGDYVMVAADLNKHPRGSTVDTSLGKGIVCDTGLFTTTTTIEIDIATTWENPLKK